MAVRPHSVSPPKISTTVENTVEKPGVQRVLELETRFPAVFRVGEGRRGPNFRIPAVIRLLKAPYTGRYGRRKSETSRFSFAGVESA
jgi:hypothetical protein